MGVANPGPNSVTRKTEPPWSVMPTSRLAPSMSPSELSAGTFAVLQTTAPPASAASHFSMAALSVENTTALPTSLCFVTILRTLWGIDFSLSNGEETQKIDRSFGSICDGRPHHQRRYLGQRRRPGLARRNRNSQQRARGWLESNSRCHSWEEPPHLCPALAPGSCFASLFLS